MRIAFLTYYVTQSHPGRKLRDSENLRSFWKSKKLKEVLNIKYKHAVSILFRWKKPSRGVLVPRKFYKIRDSISEGV